MSSGPVALGKLDPQGGVEMLSPELKGSSRRSFGLSGVERKWLHAAGVFFALSAVFSTLSIVSTILSSAPLSAQLLMMCGVTLCFAGFVGCLFGTFLRARVVKETTVPRSITGISPIKLDA